MRATSGASVLAPLASSPARRRRDRIGRRPDAAAGRARSSTTAVRSSLDSTSSSSSILSDAAGQEALARGAHRRVERMSVLLAIREAHDLAVGQAHLARALDLHRIQRGGVVHPQEHRAVAQRALLDLRAGEEGHDAVAVDAYAQLLVADVGLGARRGRARTARGRTRGPCGRGTRECTLRPSTRTNTGESSTTAGMLRESREQSLSGTP